MHGKRAAIYARFSTDLQSDRSVDDQIELCREYARRNEHTVSEAYFDKARSGTSIFGRDGLLSLLDDARAGRFEIVIVEALDRLSRDQEDLAGIHKRLSFLGIQIMAVHDGAADAIQVGIRGLVSTLFLTDLKHKIRRGMSGVVRDGRHAGGCAYGYKPTPGQPGVLQIFEPEAEVVRRVFHEAVEGALPREIAYKLNREGIQPPRGVSWNASTICGSAQRGYGILRNPVYDGRIVWNRTRFLRDPETGKRISRINDESEIKRADAPHLAIVDRGTFQRAIEMIEGRAKKMKGGHDVRRPKRLLSGILRCSHCGGGMSSHDRDKQTGAARIRCSRSKQSGICENRRTYRLDKIEKAVVSGMQAQLAHKDLLSEYVRVYREERRDEASKNARERASIERRLADVTGQMDRLMQALTRGILPVEAIEAQYKPLQEEQAQITAKLEGMAHSPVIELHPQAAEQYRRSIDQLAERMAELDDKLDAQAMTSFRELIDSVVIHDLDNGGVEVEVIGRIAALLGKDAEKLGGRMVAGDRLQRSPRMSFGRFTL